MHSVDLPFDLILLQDPDESRHPLSTAPLLQRMAGGSRLMVGDVFTEQEVLADVGPDRTALLYPSDQCPPLSVEQARSQIDTVVVLDGTWRKARRLLLLNPWLAHLPRLALTPDSPSLYLRKSPRADGLSTLEAVLTLADDWQPGQDFRSGADVLRRMEELQRAHQQGPNTPR